MGRRVAKARGLLTSAFSQTFIGPSAFFGPVLDGLRSSIRVARRPQISSSLTFVQRASSVVRSLKTSGVWLPVGSPLAVLEPVPRPSTPPAIFVAGFAACRDICAQLWPPFKRLLPLPSSLPSLTPPPLLFPPLRASIHAEFDTLSQKSLSSKIEAQAISHSPATPLSPGPFEGSRAPGAGASLTTTPPSSTITSLPSSLKSPSVAVSVGLRLRLRHVW